MRRSGTHNGCLLLVYNLQIWIIVLVFFLYFLLNHPTLIPVGEEVSQTRKRSSPVRITIQTWIRSHEPDRSSGSEDSRASRRRYDTGREGEGGSKRGRGKCWACELGSKLWVNAFAVYYRIVFSVVNVVRCCDDFSPIISHTSWYYREDVKDWSSFSWFSDIINSI